MALRIGELVGVLQADASAWERGLDRAQLRLAGMQRDTEGRLRDMRGRFQSAGGLSGMAFARQMLTTIGRSMRSGIQSAFQTGMQGLSGAAQSMNRNPYTAAIGLALAAAIVHAALPAIGALLSAAVISVTGIGIIGMGYAILKSEPEVKKATKKLKKTVKDILKDAAAPLKDEFVTAIKSVENTFEDIQPSLKRVFKSVQPLIKPLTDGFDKLVKNSLPGFTSMMEDAKPVFEGLEELMSDIGEGLSGFFREIGEGAPGAGQFLKDFGEFLKKILIDGGKFIGWLSRMYMKVRPFIEKVIGAFKWLYDVLVGNSIIPDLVMEIVGWFASLPGKILGKLQKFIGKVIGKFGQMKDRAVDKARDMVNGAVGWIRDLPGRAVRGLAGLASGIGRRASHAGSRLVGEISRGINRAISWVRGLPGRAVRALGNLGYRLYSAGRSLIAGFVRGIWSKIGDVANAAASVVSRARDYFPFSPAKRGPFSGRGWTLYSGQSLIRGFQQGIESQTPSLHQQMEQLLAALPLAGAEVSLAATGAAAGAADGGPLVNIERFEAAGRSERQVAEDLYWLSKGRG